MRMIYFLMLCLLLLAGCHSWHADKFVLRSNQLFDAEIETTDYYSFTLAVTNKSEHDITILWNKSHYLESNSTNGGFSLGTEQYYEEKDDIIPPTIIPPGGNMVRAIYPIALRQWHRRGWYRGSMDVGQHGIYLTVKAGDREYREAMVINVTTKPKKYPKSVTDPSGVRLY